MSSINNNKSDGWNIIGRSFWDIGHVYIRENENALNLFMNNIDTEQCSCIIGASGVDLIKAAMKYQIKFAVVDFSKQMCEDLAKELYPEQCTMYLHDMIYDPPQRFLNQFYYILTDQVINCFARESVPLFFKNISQMLKPYGELRTIIKIGFYDIDQHIINYGKKIGTVDNFYDMTRKTINYSKAEQELNAIVVPHQDVPKDVLVKWYMNRGEESRFELEDINMDLINQSITTGKFEIVEVKPISRLTRSMYFRFQWQPESKENNT